ncbi:hypothetical protein J6590_028377 [Homalodisca vitripennis]|nr:hypothetical protein J6590_028377 [Homalodisca vitripennis]
MEDKLKRIVTFKLNSLTTDLDYMSVEGSMWNVFQTACLAACSFKAMLGSWRTSLDLEALVGLIRYSAENIAKRIRRLRFSDGMWLQETRWVVIRAYWLCLSHGITDHNNFLGDLIPAVETLEEQIRSNVRPKTLRLLQSITESLPAQFTHGH